MSSVLTVEPLRKEFAQACAEWSMKQWQNHPINRNNTIETRTGHYKERSQNTDKIPLTFVSLRGDQPVGMVSLLEEEHEDYTHLSPWVAAMYVTPEFRKQGIATDLIQNLHKRAQDLNFSTLYLSTPDVSELYEKNGWKIIVPNARDPEGEHDSTNIMKIDLQHV